MPHPLVKGAFGPLCRALGPARRSFFAVLYVTASYCDSIAYHYSRFYSHDPTR